MWKSVTRRLARWTANVPKKGRQGSPLDGQRLVFVGGAPRSGTTLLQHILDSHSEVFGGPEFDHIPTLMEARRSVIATFDGGRIGAFCKREQIDAAFATLIQNLLLPAADACGARLLSEKTPFNVLFFSDLLELFACCRAVHIVRDPRAVIASLLNVGKRARAKNETSPPWTQHVGYAIDLIKPSLKRGFQAQQQYPDRVLTLTYEALVAQPEPILRKLCAFLGIVFYPSMLNPHSQKHPDQDKILRLDNGTWVDPNLGIRVIETSRIHAWQKMLSNEQIASINGEFRDHTDLLVLGYAFA
ncbi:MAG TPA: sulfotransferase [Gemmataceae bacterium]|jgi:hypothetical protein